MISFIRVIHILIIVCTAALPHHIVSAGFIPGFFDIIISVIRIVFVVIIPAVIVPAVILITSFIFTGVFLPVIAIIFIILTISSNNGSNNQLGTDYQGAILLIEVTSSNNDAPAVKKNIPVFFNVSRNQTNVLLFTPFVVRINPRTGACSSTECKVVTWKNHKFNKDLTTTNTIVDYRRDFSYWNFDNNINHGSGKVDNSTSNNMLNQVWGNCGQSNSLGSRVPLCYYDTKGSTSSDVDTKGIKAGYINGNNNKQIWIDPTKWIGTDGKYPNGVVIGDIRYDLDGNVSNIHAEDRKSVV